jgi:hypothetical protein
MTSTCAFGFSRYASAVSSYSRYRRSPLPSFAPFRIDVDAAESISMYRLAGRAPV